MDKTRVNALKRARQCAGLTQEKAAEMSGYSVDTIQAWEAGTRRPPVETREDMAAYYGAPWLAGMYLRELSRGSIAETMPAFEPGIPLPQAVMGLLDKVMRFTDRHSDRRLIALAADGKIDDTERSEYDSIMEDLQEICQSAMEVRFAQKGKEV